MGWSGDITEIGHMADRVADLAEVPSRAATAVAFELEGFLRDEFAEGVDPYGQPWEPLADATLQRGRKPPPLTDTTAMVRSARVKPLRGKGVAMAVGVDYAAPHQTGWNGPQGSGPARPMLPAGDALPEHWAEAIEAEVERTVRR